MSNNTTWNDESARAALRRIFDAAVKSADPAAAVRRHLPEKPRGRCVVVGAGKGAAVMAAAVDAAWPDVDVSGVVVTRYGHAVPAGRIEVLQAAHPVPDEASVQASTRILLASGATINEMNVLRRQLSAIKGGRLAQAALPARLCTLIVSDVPGDDPAAIASGPTIADPATREEARAIVARYRMELPAAAQAILATPMTPAAPHPRAEVKIIAAPMMALKAAADEARTLGLTPLILGDALEGEAAQMGTVLAGIGRSTALYGQPLAAPAVLLSGGEATVTIGSDGAGKGGRNTESLLAMALALAGQQGVWALAADSDGIDGTEDAAGAIITPDTLARARDRQLDPRAFLRAHDSYSFFAALGDLVMTGPTGTNVNDIRVMLVG